MSEPALKCENNANFDQIFTVKLFITLKNSFITSTAGGNLR